MTTATEREYARLGRLLAERRAAVVPRRGWRRLRCRRVLRFARPVYLVGALTRPLAAGAGAVPGGVELVGHLRP